MGGLVERRSAALQVIHGAGFFKQRFIGDWGGGLLLQDANAVSGRLKVVVGGFVGAVAETVQTGYAVFGEVGGIGQFGSLDAPVEAAYIWALTVESFSSASEWSSSRVKAKMLSNAPRECPPSSRDRSD